MRKSADFLIALHEVKGWNDSEISRQLGISSAAVSQWRTGKRALSPAMAVRVAELLEIEPEYVLACMHAERVDDALARPFLERLVARALGPKARALYRQIARAAKTGAVPVVAVAALLSGAYTPAEIRAVQARAEQCILRKIKRIRRKAA